jgi:ABC-type multidrug transport system ATPase subunit
MSFKDLNKRQKALVTVIRCLLRDAELYLLDNPLKGLTKPEKRDFLLKILSYLDGKGTLIYSTDDLDEARLLNFYTVILNCGYVSDAGFFEDIRKKPKELSVCRLLGINVFRGGEYIAVKPEDLKFKKSENTEGLDFSKNAKRFDFSEGAYAFGGFAKSIGIENGSAYNVRHFASLDGSGDFFSAYIFPTDGGGFIPETGGIYELFYDASKALYYNVSDEKLIDKA